MLVTPILLSMVGLLLTAHCRSSSSADAPTPLRAPVESAAPSATPGIELPEVAMIGFDPADRAVPVIAVSRTALSVEGTQLIAMTNGQIDPAELDRGAAGVIIVRLRDALMTRSDPRITIAVDRQISSELLVQLAYTVNAARPGSPLFLLARAGSQQVAAPIHAAAPGTDTSDAIGVVVSVSDTHLLVWSTSGTEGTRQDPKASVALAGQDPAAELANVVAEIAARRYGDGMRPPGTLRLRIEAAPGVPVQGVAAVIGAVRRTADGKDVFPEVVLASGG